MPIRLEFDSFDVLLSKKRWNLYFVIVTDHPTDTDKMLVRLEPTGAPILLKPAANNRVSFVPNGGSTGLITLKREMPNDNTIRVRTYLRHDRSKTRDLGDVINKIRTDLGDDAIGMVADVLGIGMPWLVIAKGAIAALEGILKNIGDKDFGMVNMDIAFDAPNATPASFKVFDNFFSTGRAKITWKWVIQ